MRQRTIVVIPVLLAIITSSCITFEDFKEPASMPVLTGFQELQTDFVHQWDGETHPFTGAAVIDIEGDGQLELFVGGGQGQDDVLLFLSDGVLIDKIADFGLSRKSATHGATAFDIDNDSDTDLIIARDNGLFLYINSGAATEWQFNEIEIPVDLDENALVLDITVNDVNKDGLPDLYLSSFVRAEHFKSATFNDPKHAKTNRLLLNLGDYLFRDVTSQSGLRTLQNTFMSVFIDLNGDAKDELLVSQNTGEIEIYTPIEDLVFEPLPFQSGYGFWMGLAVGDIDNDGDQDLFFSNLGNSIPSFLTTGDLTDIQQHNPSWKLLINDGDLQLRDNTHKFQLSDYGFAWGAVFEDLNLDGRLDLLVAQNYIKWPVHKLSKLPGKAFLQLPHEEAFSFYHADDLNLNNPYFGQSPVIIDFNGDGRQDVAWINKSGPLRVLLNRSEQPFITVRIPDNVEYSGAKVSIVSDSPVYTRVATNSVGLMTDQTSDMSFALAEQKLVSIQIIKQNGERVLLENLSPNGIHIIE